MHIEHDFDDLTVTQSIKNHYLIVLVKCYSFLVKKMFGFDCMGCMHGKK